jgi:hypothetical protein
MSKKVPIGTKPAAPPPPPTAEQWVQQVDPGRLKRLTIDLPAKLHARVKSECALRGVHMNEEIRKLLEAHFGFPE